MRVIKALAIALVAYALVVVAFESLLGYFQPQSERTLTITTFNGEPRDRVLTELSSGDQSYVAVNHWPRAWYHRTLDNPNVRVTRKGETANYLAVPIAGEERSRVEGDHPVGLTFRILTGFPPRHFLRLDPQAE
ncbi:MAG: nitroreductase/quinone reductase family protein [Gammaproteobacteria bacterium]|nr:nitroreductase/quinone reductase family protein [Gammaproteobacteria bacterium]